MARGGLASGPSSLSFGGPSSLSSRRCSQQPPPCSPWQISPAAAMVDGPSERERGNVPRQRRTPSRARASLHLPLRAAMADGHGELPWRRTGTRTAMADSHGRSGELVPAAADQMRRRARSLAVVVEQRISGRNAELHHQLLAAPPASRALHGGFAGRGLAPSTSARRTSGEERAAAGATSPDDASPAAPTAASRPGVTSLSSVPVHLSPRAGPAASFTVPSVCSPQTAVARPPACIACGVAFPAAAAAAAFLMLYAY